MAKARIMPHDVESAKQVMKNFSEMAYAVAYKERFQAAVRLLYGSDFVITEDLSKRMQFACIICNREMNSENAMQEHYRSGPHQKNRDKRNREGGGTSHTRDAHQYAKDSLQYRLLSSQTNPIGLQMVEEYKNDRGNTYYKCFLCGAHGKLEAIYNHIINKPHTEKYIKTAIDLETGILTSNEREHLRKHIIDRHGINVEAIKVIRGSEYYPKKWETEGRTFKNKIKKERRSMSHSPSPNSTKYSHRSPSPTWGKWRGKSRHDSRSPSRSYRGSPSRQRSTSPSPSPLYSKWKRKGRRNSHSHEPSSSTRRGRSPKKSRKHKDRKKRSSSSSSSSSQASQRSQSPGNHKYRIDMPTPREKGRGNRDPWEDSSRSQFRNRSPPTPSSARVPTPARVEALRHTTLAMPGPSGYSSTNLPTPLTSSRVNTLDKGTQKVNLEELMMQLNFLVKTQHMPSSKIKQPKDVEKSLNMMFILTKTLYEVINFNIEDGLSIAENINKHNMQKQILKKMMGYLKTYMMPAAGIE